MNTQIKIIVQGRGTDLNDDFDGLVLNAPSTITGLALTNFAQAIVIDSDNNRIVGNFIGILPDGATRRDNTIGVRFEGAVKDNQIGGAKPAERNLITGNQTTIWDSVGTRTRVQGNYVGTDKTGLTRQSSVLIMGIGTTELTIGGLGAGEGNVIAGGSPTIQLGYPVGAKVIGNNIGVGADNKANIGGMVGIEVLEGMNVSNVRAQILLNKIANHSKQGVTIWDTKNIVLSRNSIYNNGGLGIDFLDGIEDVFGVNANDNKDADYGVNMFQNFPVLKKVTPSVAGTTIKGTSIPRQTELFASNCSPTPAATQAVMAKVKDIWASLLSRPTTKATPALRSRQKRFWRPGMQVTATATSSNNQGMLFNTSEFSKCKAAS